MLGTLVLVGGAPADARFSLDHLPTLWGKRVIGVLGGGGRSGQLIPALVELYQQGRFPFDRLVQVLRAGRHRAGARRLEVRQVDQADPAHARGLTEIIVEPAGVRAALRVTQQRPNRRAL